MVRHSEGELGKEGKDEIPGEDLPDRFCSHLFYRFGQHKVFYFVVNFSTVLSSPNPPLCVLPLGYVVDGRTFFPESAGRNWADP